MPAPSRTAMGRRFFQQSSPALAKQVVQLSCLCNWSPAGAALPAGSHEPQDTGTLGKQLLTSSQLLSGVSHNGKAAPKVGDGMPATRQHPPSSQVGAKRSIWVGGGREYLPCGPGKPLSGQP